MNKIKFLLLAASKLGALELSFQTLDRPGYTNTFVRGIENGVVVGYTVNSSNIFEAPGSGGGSGTPFIWRNGEFSTLDLRNFALPPGSTVSSLPIAAPNDIVDGVVYGYELYAYGRNLNVGPRGFIHDTSGTLVNIDPWGSYSGRVYSASEGVIVGARWDFTAFQPWSGLVYKNGDFIEAKHPLGGSTIFYAINGDTVYGLVSGTGAVSFDLITRTFSDFGYNFAPYAVDGDLIVGSTGHPEGSGGRGAILGPQGLHLFDFPGAVMTKVYGVSGNQISGTYLDSSGFYHGYIATILDPDITDVIDETDSRIVNGRSLSFRGGALRPTVAGVTIESDVIIKSGSTGTLDSIFGSIEIALNGSVQIFGDKLVIQGSDLNEILIKSDVTGDGLIQVDSGLLRLTGTNASGGLLAFGGTTIIDSENGLTNDGNIVEGGTVVLASENGTQRTFAQSFALKGEGYTSQGALVLGTKDATNGVRLTGDLSMMGDASVTFSSLQTNGFSELSSAIDSSVAGVTLSLSVLGDAILTSTISSNVSQVVKNGLAVLSLEQGFSHTGLLVVDAGLLDVTRTDFSFASELLIRGGAVRLLPGEATIQQVNADIVLSDLSDLSVAQLTYGDGTQTLAVTQVGSISLSDGSGNMKVHGGVGSLVTFSGDMLAVAPANLGMRVESLNTARIEGASDATLTLLKSGAGSIELASGLSGKSFRGTLDSADGQVVVLSGNSLPESGLAVYGGDLILQPSDSEYSSDITLGSATNNRLVIEDMPGSVILQSDVVWGGSGVVEVRAGNHLISGLHTAQVSPVEVDMSVAAGAELTISGEIRAGILLSKSGGGVLLLDANSGVSGYAGKLKSTLGFVGIQTPESMPLDGIRMEGGMLELNGGISIYSSAIDIVAPSTTTLKLSGRDEAGQMRGVILASDVSLTSDLIIDVGDTSHISSGLLSGASNEVDVRLGIGSRLTLNSTWTVGELLLSGAGAFSIASTGSVNSNIVLSASELSNNGTIRGNVEVAAGSKLSGSGNYDGIIINRGTVGPGNSPGVLNVDGMFTAATASNIEMEVFGNTGAGLAAGHDQIKVTGMPGTIVIEPGASISLVKGAGFEPARASTFKLFDAVGGISGKFDNLVSGFDQWVLLDYKTGNLYGTALLPSESLSKYDQANGAIAWDAGVSVVTNSALNGYVGVIDGSSPLGQAVISILSGTPILGGAVTPDVYLSLVQIGTSSADMASRSILGRLDDRRFAWRPIRGGMPDGWFVDFGNQSAGSDSRVLRDYQVASYSAGYVNELSDTSTIIVALAHSEFDGSASRAVVDGSGTCFALAWSQMLDSRRRDVALDFGMAYSRDAFDVSRGTFLGQYAATANSRTVSIFGRLTAGVGLTGGISATPYIGVRYAHVSQDDVSELAAPNTVSVDAFSHSSTIVEAGASLHKVVSTRRGDLRFSVGMELAGEIGDTTESSSYSMLGRSYAMSADIAPRTTLEITPAITFDASSGATYSISVPWRTGDGYDSVTVNIGFSHKF